MTELGYSTASSSQTRFCGAAIRQNYPAEGEDSAGAARVLKAGLMTNVQVWHENMNAHVLNIYIWIVRSHKMTNITNNTSEFTRQGRKRRVKLVEILKICVIFRFIWGTRTSFDMMRLKMYIDAHLMNQYVNICRSCEPAGGLKCPPEEKWHPVNLLSVGESTSRRSNLFN